MTEISPPRAQQDHHPSAATATTTVLNPLPAAVLNGYTPPLDGPDEEEDSTIKCICGFDDDDGNTVFCEICKTWQHIVCYYLRPDAVPEVHECVDCKPRYINHHGATERQQQARLLLPITGDRKLKRPPTATKPVKKRTKDATQPNGLRAPASVSANDRGSGSPRDHQPPPAKRPKTNHKSSSSTSAPNPPGHSRKRNGSVALGRSPMKQRQQSPPTYRGEFYSSQFMQLYRGADFTPIHHNSFASISVSNDLSSWLQEPESLRHFTKLTPSDIFQRWDKPIEALEQLSPGVSEVIEDDPSMTLHGHHPRFHSLVANGSVDKEAYIGELKGQIGRKEDYFRDPSNRWDELHHPEPFVFFHDHLPVYIDSRTEGTTMRYVRRSCRPNVKIQVIVLGTSYHFCLVSTREIFDREEVTLGWNVPDKANHLLHTWLTKGNLDPSDEDYMVNWASSVLANFGNCACGQPQGSCPLDRFDRRVDPRVPQAVPTLSTNTEKAKVRRPKKNGTTHVSPLSTGRATNSRAVSEAAINGEPDEDIREARSVSASSRSKPASRDNTPPIGLGVELSDREKRKLQQQERLFEQLQQVEHGTGKKKKRNSAGSALNTPSVNTEQKQLGLPDSSDPSPTAAHATSLKVKSSGQADPAHTGQSANGHPQELRQKPVYTNGGTQTEMKSPTIPAVDPDLLRQASGSAVQRVRKMIMEERKRAQRAAAERKTSLPPHNPVSPVSDSPMKDGPGVMGPPPVPAPLSSAQRSVPPETTTAADPRGVPTEDVEMIDAQPVKQEEVIKSVSPVLAAPTIHEPSETGTSTLNSSHDDQSSRRGDGGSPEPPAKPAAGELSASISTSALSAPTAPLANSTVQAALVPDTTTQAANSAKKSPSPSSRGPSLHVQLPPVPTFTSSNSTASAQTPTTPSVTDTPTSLTAQPLPSPSTALHSPNAVFAAPPLMSPGLMTPGGTAVNGFMTQPSPLKKKMSLSDYTRRIKSVNKPSTTATGGGGGNTLSTADAASDAHRSSSPVAPAADARTAVESADETVGAAADDTGIITKQSVDTGLVGRSIEEKSEQGQETRNVEQQTTAAATTSTTNPSSSSSSSAQQTQSKNDDRNADENHSPPLPSTSTSTAPPATMTPATATMTTTTTSTTTTSSAENISLPPPQPAAPVAPMAHM